MPGVTFQSTVGTSAVRATDIAAIASAVVRSGVRVTPPADNSAKVYFGWSNAVTTSTGELIPNGAPFTINPDEFPLVNGKPDLGSLYFIAGGASQTITGSVL